MRAIICGSLYWLSKKGVIFLSVIFSFSFVIPRYEDSCKRPLFYYEKPESSNPQDASYLSMTSREGPGADEGQNMLLARPLPKATDTAEKVTQGLQKKPIRSFSHADFAESNKTL